MNRLIRDGGRFESEVQGGPGLPMRVLTKLAAATLALLAGLSPAKVRGAEEGIALAIIYDTSGSMKESVPDAVGGFTPKYLIANRALREVTRQLQAAATNSNQKAARNIQAGLFTFQGDHAREVVKFGPLDTVSLENWAEHFSTPHGNTPLGNALSTAAHSVIKSPLSRKHVLVITDGVNTAGPTPQAVLPGLHRLANEHGTSLSVHFIAFDVDARQFAAVKRLGATVVGAADEKQLNSQLQFILQQKILLEDEEPAKTH